jgi:hypothetical protein
MGVTVGVVLGVVGAGRALGGRMLLRLWPCRGDWMQRTMVVVLALVFCELTVLVVSGASSCGKIAKEGVCHLRLL